MQRSGEEIIQEGPETDEVFRALSRLKEELHINIELVPSNFIPPIPGWEDRSINIGSEGTVSFYHYDPYSQALSKIERGHARRDIQDIAGMIERGLVERDKLAYYFGLIEPYLYKYPAIDAEEFADAVKRITELPNSAS